MCPAVPRITCFISLLQDESLHLQPKDNKKRSVFQFHCFFIHPIQLYFALRKAIGHLSQGGYAFKRDKLKQTRIYGSGAINPSRAVNLPVIAREGSFFC